MHRNKFYRIAVCGKTASTVRRRGTGYKSPVSTLRYEIKSVAFDVYVAGGGRLVRICTG